MRRLPGLHLVTWILIETFHPLDRLVFQATHGRHAFTSLMTGLPIVMLTTQGPRRGCGCRFLSSPCSTVQRSW